MNATPTGKGVASPLTPKEEPKPKRHRSSSGQRGPTSPGPQPGGAPGRSTSAPPPPAANGADAPDAAPRAEGLAAAVDEEPPDAPAAPGATKGEPEDAADIEIVSSEDGYDEDPDEHFYGHSSGPPDAAITRLHYMERQHEQLADTVDTMQTQLAGVLSSQALLTDHVTGLERGLATVVTQQQAASGETAALRGDIHALLGHLSGGTLHLPNHAQPIPPKQEPAVEAAAEAEIGHDELSDLAAIPVGPPGADKGNDKGRASQGPY